MTFRHFAQLGLATLLLTLFVAPSGGNHAHAKPPFTLESIQQGLLSRYEGVSHMSIARLQKDLAGPGKSNYLVLDAREKDEFAVSHIPGARRVDPGIWHSSFMSKFGKIAKGKTVVIYCSVGERSSKMAKYVQAALIKNGAKGVYNLQGGIFQWHNEKRPLMASKGKTDYVHPYNKYWGQLLKRSAKLRYSPK
ncbi:MAG: rhodanese-like domain-containing protein [Hyphomicrobiaceae bacterium]|nr:rhodanese-like domain-containing protein [Hyphomicrobiaceae bacterium]